MTKAEKFLNYILDLQKKVDIKTAQIRRLHERLTSLSVPTDKEHVDHTPNYDVMGETIALIVQLEKEIDIQTKQLVAMQNRADVYFDLLTPDSNSVLTERYKNGRTIEEIAAMRGISGRTVYRQHKDAIMELDELLPEGNDY